MVRASLSVGGGVGGGRGALKRDRRKKRTHIERKMNTGVSLKISLRLANVQLYDGHQISAVCGSRRGRWENTPTAKSGGQV